MEHNFSRKTYWIYAFVALLCQVYAWETRIDPKVEDLDTAIKHCNCNGIFPEILVNGSSNHANAFRIVDNYTVDVHVTNSKMFLICRAPYPVTWTFHEYPKVGDNMRTWRINTKRTFQDINNISTYEYEASLSFRFRPPSQLPAVTCRDAMKPKAIQTAVVNVPHESYMRLSVIPNSDKTPKPVNSRYGQNPGCAINLTYNKLTNQVCCTTKNTTFFSRGCSDPASCQGFYSKTNCTQNMSYDTTDPDSCMDAKNDLAVYGSAGVIVCKSADMDPASDSNSATIPYFTSLLSNCSSKNSSRLPVLYTDLDNPTDISEFLEVCDPPNNPIYATESVKFQCDGSYYFFSSGYRWVLKRKQKPDEIIDFKDEELLGSSLPSEKIIKTTRKLETNIYFHDADVYEISCYAPIWNSFGWVTKTIEVDVRDPKPISFLGGPSQTIDTFQPNQIINCSATGEPTPTLDWDVVPEWASLIETNSSSWIALQLPNDTSNLDEYIFRCRATQERIHRNDVKEFRVKRGESKLTIIISTATVLSIFILGTLLCVKKYMQWSLRTRALNKAELSDFYKGRRDSVIGVAENEANKACNLPWDKKYEIEARDLKLGQVIGEGHSSVVYKGSLKLGRGWFGVACKTIKPFSPIEVLKISFSELKLQIFIGPHENIVRLYGAQIKNLVQREIYIVTEFCENGNLLDFLRNKRHVFLNNFSFPLISGQIQNGDNDDANLAYLSFNHLLNWAHDIANGMAFLSSKGIIHGDLAARNVFVTKGLTVKIGDYGLSHQLIDYTYTASDRLAQPWQWIAPECFYEKEFSVKSDVWSFGVTLFEVFSLGGIPWAEMGKLTPQKLYGFLMGGIRMSRPELATQDIYEIIQKCWKGNRHDRPSFKFLQASFFDIINDTYVGGNSTVGYVTLDFSEPKSLETSRIIKSPVYVQPGFFTNEAEEQL